LDKVWVKHWEYKSWITFKLLSLKIWKPYGYRFVLKSAFIKIYIYRFPINIFYRNKKSKLCFRDRVAVQNDLNYQYGESIFFYKIMFKISTILLETKSKWSIVWNWWSIYLYISKKGHDILYSLLFCKYSTNIRIKSMLSVFWIKITHYDTLLVKENRSNKVDTKSKIKRGWIKWLINLLNKLDKLTLWSCFYSVKH